MLLCMMYGTAVIVPILMFFFFFFFFDLLFLQLWDGEQDFFPDVWEIVFPNIPV